MSRAVSYGSPGAVTPAAYGRAVLFDAPCAVCRHGVGPVCPSCAQNLGSPTSVAVPDLHRCTAAFELDDGVRSLIAAFKYRRQRRLAAWLAQRLQPHTPLAADVITWIPATPEHRRDRGFDQGQELARALAARTGVPTRRLLVRQSNDGGQTGQSRTARLSGPDLSPSRRSAPFVVLVDDVVTTGSSLRTGAQQLKSAGAERIVGVVAAATHVTGTQASTA